MFTQNQILGHSVPTLRAMCDTPLPADGTPSPPTAAPSDTAAHPLPLTGERTLPGIADERYWFLRHVIAYRVAGEVVAAHTFPAVLDAGCGEGYGLALLADAGAGRVLGVDLDEPTVSHARQRYAARDQRIEVEVAELREVPLPDDSCEVAVSFQVIEHLHDIPGFLAELRRVTRPGGQVLLATPNRLTFTPDSDTPVNPFHTVEFTAQELTTLLERAGLTVERMLGVHHAGRLREVELERGVSLPRLLGATAPDAWPPWLRQVVHDTEETDFRIGADQVDASLDLLAICREPA